MKIKGKVLPFFTIFTKQDMYYISLYGSFNNCDLPPIPWYMTFSEISNFSESPSVPLSKLFSNSSVPSNIGIPQKTKSKIIYISLCYIASDLIERMNFDYMNSDFITNEMLSVIPKYVYQVNHPLLIVLFKAKEC